MTWAAIFRHYYEAKGWSPERIKLHTPGQLAAMAASSAAPPSFRSLEDTLAWARAKKSGG